MTALLEVKNVVKYFNREGSGWIFSPKAVRFCVLNQVSFNLSDNEIVGLVGESGSGKTTLGKSILRLHPIDGGEILLDGRNIHQLDARTLRKLRPRYQMIFQNPHSSLNPGMRVADVLMETVVLHLGLQGSGASDRVAEALRTVRLGGKEGKYPAQLSGGEKRRVGLARALLLSPRLLIADEPTAGLDAALKAGIIHLMLETRAKGMAYLFISHDLNLIRYVAQRVMVMYQGRIVEVMAAASFELGARHHPYTEVLLHSFQMGARSGMGAQEPLLRSSDTFSLPEGAGCCYYPRCGKAQLLGAKADICKRQAPILTSGVEPGEVACHFV